MLFNPSSADVRRFFCQTYNKHQRKHILTPLENIAARWIVEHPEYHLELSDETRAIQQQYSPEQGNSNPFLHLAMHLSISESVQADLPQGLNNAYHLLLNKTGDPHRTHHAIMEVLGRVLWEAQRSKTTPNMMALVEGVLKLV